MIYTITNARKILGLSERQIYRRISRAGIVSKRVLSPEDFAKVACQSSREAVRIAKIEARRRNRGAL